jgi:hypothetical protein
MLHVINNGQADMDAQTQGFPQSSLASELSVEGGLKKRLASKLGLLKLAISLDRTRLVVRAKGVSIRVKGAPKHK